jgi:hypothetical protein
MSNLSKYISFFLIILFLLSGCNGGQVTVPDVTGFTRDAAESKLQAAGFNLDNPKSDYSVTVPFGSVMSTDPPAGAKVSQGTTVILTISIGASPTPTPMPTATSTPTPMATPTSTATPLPGAVIGDFIGTWVNSDPNTGGMTELKITKINPTTVAFHGFGKCHPTDCDWSKIAGSDVIVPFTPYTLVGTYDFGFEKTTITVFRQGSQLKATAYYQYPDSTKNTTETDLMNGSKLFIPPIKLNPTLIFILPTETP